MQTFETRKSGLVPDFFMRASICQDDYCRQKSSDPLRSELASLIFIDECLNHFPKIDQLPVKKMRGIGKNAQFWTGPH